MKTNVCEWALAATLALCPILSPAQSTGGGADTIVSISFANGQPKSNEVIRVGETGTLGIAQVPATAWVDLVVPDRSQDNQALRGSENITAAYAASASVTLPTPIRIEYWATNGWSYGNDATRTFLRAYLDDSSGGASVFLTDIPFATYDVIVYCATDNGSGFVPVTINGTRYSWGTDGLIANAAANAFWGTIGANTAELGRNAIRVDGLSGDLSIVGGASQNNTAKRGGIAAIQIVGHGDFIAPVQVRALSVNFASGQNPNTFNVPDTETAAYGLVSVPGNAWKNVTGATGTDVEIDAAYGFELSETNRPTLSYGAALTWHYGTDATPVFLRGFLSDAEGATPITVKNIPFSSYDVIIYYGADDANGAYFKPISVNGHYYTWDEATGATVPTEDTSAFFGQTSQNYVAYGVNALRIPVPEGGDLTIERQTRGNGGRCSIAAFQIVCTGDVIDTTPTPVMSLNFSSGADKDGFVRSSAVSDLTGAYGLVPAPAEAWVDLTTASNASGQTVTTLHGDPLVAGWTGATVTWNAKKAWSYTTSQVTDLTEPFLKTYLDDGDSGGSGASVSVTNLPFEAYDVIVYNAADAGKAFAPVTINGTRYKGDATVGAVVASSDTDNYGPNVNGAVSGLATATLGTNALRVDKLIGPLAIQGKAININDNNSPAYARAGIAAVQIVGREIVEVALSGAVTAEELAARLAGLPEDAMARLTFAAGTQVSGDVDLSGVIVDLSGYAAGETPPFSGTVTVDQRTVVRVAGDVRRIVLTSGAIQGTLRPANIYIGDVAATGATVADGTITLALTFQWTGEGGDTLWSNPANWSSGLVPGAEDEVSIPLAAANATITIDTAATVAALTISGPTATGTGTATLALSAQGDGALTVSGQMLTTGNVAVTQNANITVRGATTTVQMDMGGGQTMAPPGQAGFHVDQATYTVVSGATLAVLATEGVSDTGEVGMSNGAIVTVAEGAMLTAKRTRVTYYGGKISGGTLNLGGTVTFTQTLTLNTGNYTVNLAGGTLTTPLVRLYEKMVASGNATLVGPMTFSVSGTNAQTLSGAGNLTLTGAVTFGTSIGEAYTGEITVADGASVTLGEGRPKLTTLGAARVSVTPSAEEEARGQIVFPTSMGTVPEGATFTVADVTETVTPAVVDGELTLSWPVTIPTLAKSSAWSAVGNWTDVSGDAAPTSGAAILDGTAAPITVKLDTALTGMTAITVRGDVTLAATDTQPTIPACVTLADGATLTIGADFPDTVSIASKWVLPEGTTLVVTKPIGFYRLALNGRVVFKPADGTTCEADKAVFPGGLTIEGNAITLSNVLTLGGEVVLEGDNITIAGTEEYDASSPESGSLFYMNADASLVNRGEGNRLAPFGSIAGTIQVASGSLTLRMSEHSQSNLADFEGAVVDEGATLTVESLQGGRQFPVSGAGAVDFGTVRPQFAAFTDAQGTVRNTLPSRLVLMATDVEQENNLISFTIYNGGASLPEGFVAEVTPAKGGLEWVPMSALEGNQLRIRNVPGTGIAGLSAEAELAIRKWWRKEVGRMPTSPYVVEVYTGEETYDASSSAEGLALLNGVFACFENVVLSADVAGDSETPSTIALWYDFGIAEIVANGTGLNVTVRAEQDPETPLKFRAGAVVEVLCGGEVVGWATAEEGNGGTVTVTLGTIPEGEIAVRVTDEPATTPEQ